MDFIVHSSSDSCSDEKRPAKKARHIYFLRSCDKEQALLLSSTKVHASREMSKTTKIFSSDEYNSLLAQLKEMVNQAKFRNTTLSVKSLSWSTIASNLKKSQTDVKDMFMQMRAKVELLREMINEKHAGYIFLDDIITLPNDFWSHTSLKTKYECFSGVRGIPCYGLWLDVMTSIIDEDVAVLSAVKGKKRSAPAEIEECSKKSKSMNTFQSMSVASNETRQKCLGIIQNYLGQHLLDVAQHAVLSEMFKDKFDAVAFLSMRRELADDLEWLNVKIGLFNQRRYPKEQLSRQPRIFIN